MYVFSVLIALFSCNCGSNNNTPITALPADNSGNWAYSLYNKSDTSEYTVTTHTVTYFKQINDSVSYCLIDIDDQLVCLKTMLAVQINRNPVKEQEIRSACDGDLSIPFFNYSEYNLDSSTNSIRYVIYNQSADLKYLEQDKSGNLKFKDGYDMENAEIKEDSVVSLISVLPTGKLNITVE